MNKTQMIIKELQINKDVRAAKIGCLSQVARKFEVSPKKVGELYRKVRLSQLVETMRKQR